MRENREDKKAKKAVNGGKMKITNLFPLSNGIIKEIRKI